MSEVSRLTAEIISDVNRIFDERDQLRADLERVTRERDAAVAANRSEFEGHKLTVADHKRDIARADRLQAQVEAQAATIAALREAIQSSLCQSSHQRSFDILSRVLANPDPGAKVRRAVPSRDTERG